MTKKTLRCTNEFIFDGIYLRTETLELNGGFIAQTGLLRKFPNLRVVRVFASSFQTDQCNALKDSSYLIVGCDKGKITCLHYLCVIHHVPLRQCTSLSSLFL